MPQITIITLIYKSEEYFERCLHSLFGQTLKDIEYIFVNDCSPDKSMLIFETVLKEYPERKKQIRIVNHQTNKGTMYSRLEAMKLATGEYVIHCDSDDWIELNTVQLLYENAKNRNSDIVIFNYAAEYSNKRTISNRRMPYNTGRDIIKNIYKTGFQWYSPVYLTKNRPNLIAKIPRIENLIIWEDILIGVTLFYYSNNITYLDDVLYHYNKVNDNSVSSNISLSQTIKCFEVIEQLKKFIIPKDRYCRAFNFLTFQSKYWYLINSTTKEWRKIHPECHKDIKYFTIYSKRLRIIYRLLASGISFPYKAYMKYSQYISPKND